MSIPDYLLITEAIVFGLVIGSFLNVCIFRLPQHLSLMGRSFCPRCKKTIPFYRNIPVVTYLLQRGRSACCHESIASRYPLVEALTALVSVITLLHSGSLSQYFLWFVLFMCPLIVVAFIDFEHQIIPDVISLPFIGVGVLVHLYEGWPDWLAALISSGLGILAGGGALLLLAEIISRLKKTEALGGGDVKLAGLFGAFLGWRPLIFIFFASSVLALTYVAVGMILRGKRDDPKIPFGPFLSLAAMIAWLYGKPITDAYFLGMLKFPVNLIFP